MISYTVMFLYVSIALGKFTSFRTILVRSLAHYFEELMSVLGLIRYLSAGSFENCSRSRRNSCGGLVGGVQFGYFRLCRFGNDNVNDWSDPILGAGRGCGQPIHFGAHIQSLGQKAVQKCQRRHCRCIGPSRSLDSAHINVWRSLLCDWISHGDAGSQDIRTLCYGGDILQFYSPNHRIRRIDGHRSIPVWCRPVGFAVLHTDKNTGGDPDVIEWLSANCFRKVLCTVHPTPVSPLVSNRQRLLNYNSCDSILQFIQDGGVSYFHRMDLLFYLRHSIRWGRSRSRIDHVTHFSCQQIFQGKRWRVLRFL